MKMREWHGHTNGRSQSREYDPLRALTTPPGAA